MAHVINDGCLMCGACAGTCPVGAISEGADKYDDGYEVGQTLRKQHIMLKNLIGD